MPTLRWPTEPPKRTELLSFFDASSFDASSFDAAQIRWPWEGFLIWMYLIVLVVHYVFAIAARFFSVLRGKLRHRVDRFAFYSPILGHTFLLVSLWALDGHRQERVYLLWQVAQLMVACASDISLWRDRADEFVLLGRLLSGACFAVANLIFYLRVVYEPHVWKLTGGSLPRANFWVAICLDLIFLTGYMCRVWRATIAAVKGEKKE